MQHLHTEVLAPEDIIRIIISEERLVLSRIQKVVKGREYQHFVKTSTKKAAYPVTIKDGCKLDYTVVLSNDWTNYANNIFGFTIFVMYMSSQGYQLIDCSRGQATDQDGQDFSFRKFKLYTRHFFDRYRERVLKNKNLEKEGIIKYFIRNHYGDAIEHIQSDLEGPDEYCFPMSDCFGLGEKISNDYSIVKSCITDDMLRESQIEIKQFCEQQLHKDKEVEEKERVLCSQ